jgi:hypothetical protein
MYRTLDVDERRNCQVTTRSGRVCVAVDVSGEAYLVLKREAALIPVRQI